MFSIVGKKCFKLWCVLCAHIQSLTMSAPGQTQAYWRSKTSRELKLMLCRPVSINFTFTRQDYKKKSNSCKGKAMVLLNVDTHTKDEFKLIHGAGLYGFLPLT